MRYVKITDGRVAYIRKGKTIVDGEIQSEFGKPGQVYKDGIFSDYIPTQEELCATKTQQEITELNTWLDLRRNIEHPDKATKQARLLELLG